MENKFISWISLASTSGLSVISLGSPGLKSDLDEQVFVGGISAVTSLLSSEIGSDDRTFIGGGDTRKFGRFVVSVKDQEIISQFLIMSEDGTKIPDSMISLYQEIALEFAQKIGQSELWEKSIANYSTLSPLEYSKMFIDTITENKRKIKGLNQDELYEKNFKEILEKFTLEPQNSIVLSEIKDTEPDLIDLKEKILPKQKKLVSDLLEEIIAISLLEDPIFIISKSKPNDIYKDSERLLIDFKKNELLHLTTQQLRAISSELFKSGEIVELLSGVSVFDLRKSRHVIYKKLENEFILRISKRSPLILLLNDKLQSSLGEYELFINSQTDIIFREFDLASILGKIAYSLLEGERKVPQYLLSEFIRSFSMRFPGGLSLQAWKFTQTLFNIFSNQTGINIDEAISSLEISETHLTTINTQLKEIKPSEDLQSLSFTITREGDELVKFYDALEVAICESVQKLFDEAIWSNKKLGIYSLLFAEKVESFANHAQNILGFLAILKNLFTHDYETMNVENLNITIDEILTFKLKNTPIKEDIKKLKINSQLLVELWEPDIFIGTIRNLVQNQFDKEFSSFIEDRDFISNQAEKIYNDLGNYFKSYKPGNSVPLIPKKPKESVFDQSTHTGNSRMEIWKSYSEFYRKTYDYLDEIDKIGKEARKNKKREKDLEKTINRRKSDILKNFEGMRKRLDEVEKRVKANQQNFSKRIEKDYSRLLRDSKKLYLNAGSPEFKTIQTSSKSSLKFSFIKYNQLMSPISKEISEKCSFEENFPPTNQAVHEFARLLIFNDVSKGILNKSILEILKSDNRTSPLLLDFINSIKTVSPDNEGENDFVEKFKKFLRNNAEKKIKIIIESITNQISNSYISKSLKTYPIFKKHIEIACFDLGEIPDKFNDQFKSVSNVLGPNIYKTKVDNKNHLFLEIEEFPSSGSALPILRAIGQAAWNQTIADELGFFIEILKMSSELLGELKRKKFQSLIETFYELTF